MKKVIILSIALVLLATGCTIPKKKTVLKPDEAKAKAEQFINDNLMQQGNKVSVKEVTEVGDLYKFKVSLPRGQEIDSYMTKDGVTFFPQAMNIQETEDKSAKTDNTGDTENAEEQAPVAEVSKKSDKPKVEAFVMSHCPFGTQIEKGLIPVAELLKDKIDFNIKFVNYAMHGEKEVKEQMLQYCINKVEKAKYMTYLKCFLSGDDKTSECLKGAKIDMQKVNSCQTQADKEFKIMENFNNKDSWLNGRFPKFDIYAKENDQYGVQGSPTLVINGEQVQSGRDSASLLKAICSGFNKQPKECTNKLSSAQPSAGFGYGTDSANAAAAQCGN